jgi:dynein heavy chain
LNLLVEKARRTSDKVFNEFTQMSRKILQRTNSIEELTSQKEFMNTIPRLTGALKRKIQKMLVHYDMIEKFNYPVNQDDFDQKWQVVGWTKKLYQQMEEAASVQDRSRKRFEKDLHVSQDAFNTALKEFTRDVAGKHFHSNTLTKLVLSRHKDISKVEDVYNEVMRIDKLLKDSVAKVNLFHSRERLFGFPETPYDELNRLLKDFSPYSDLWTTAHDWFMWQKQWENESFNSLDPDQMERDITTSWKKIFKVVAAFKDKPEVLAIATQIQQQIADFKPHLPLITSLRNPGMRPRHWQQLSTHLGFKLQPDATFTLKDLFSLNLENFMESISKTCDMAGKEFAIENMLDKMEKEWQDKKFTIVDYRDSGTHILRSPEEISQLLDDHLVTTQSMNFSVYKKAFESRIAKWETTLTLIADILDAWLLVQKQWLYLEPIFSSEDIHHQMPTEGKRFTTMDRNWRRIMQKAAASPKVMEFASNKKLLVSFQECNKLLELVQKGLTEYLETKCAAFPRFYFLSSDDLLQILSQSKDVTAVQPHLHKVRRDLIQSCKDTY